MITVMDWVRIGLVIAIAVLMIGFNIQLDRRRKIEDARYAKNLAGERAMLATMKDASDYLKESVLAALWLKHAAYRADEETPPLTVKCIECGDIAGTANGVEDIFPIAHSHVVEKYDELVRDVKRRVPEPATT